MICTRCFQHGKTKTNTPGSFLIEVFLWFCFLIPGMIYSVWRLTARSKVCKSCGSSDLVSIDSPRGKMIMNSVENGKASSF